jgi:hypothetical protein
MAYPASTEQRLPTALARLGLRRSRDRSSVILIIREQRPLIRAVVSLSETLTDVRGFVPSIC